ncbi:MAG TPA: hypothetical protein PKD53_02735 [Chloroflexaceae bacterium]|nr:hypothetical protein [Chloroflexaceae bacterium]
MSGKNNVNKDHYTQAGRDRPNENVVHDDHKEALTRKQKRIATGEAAVPKGQRVKSRAEQPPIVIGADNAELPPREGEDEDKGEE